MSQISNNKQNGFDDVDVDSRRRKIRLNQVGSFRSEISPPSLVRESVEATDSDLFRSRRLLAQHIEKGEGDLNTTRDEKRIKKRKRLYNIFTVIFITMLIVILALSLAGLGVSIYTFIQDQNTLYDMKLYGIVGSSVFIAYSLFSMVFVAIDRFYLHRNKIGMQDYKFLLDVDIKQFSMDNENILLYTPELLTNQIVPKYQETPSPFPQRIDMPQISDLSKESMKNSDDDDETIYKRNDTNRAKSSKSDIKFRRIGNFRNEISPSNLKIADRSKLSQIRKELSLEIANSDGDLNVISDLYRLRRRRKCFIAWSIIFYVLLILIFCGASAGLGVSIYTYVSNQSINTLRNMQLYGIVASSVFMAYALISIVIVSIDRFYLEKNKSVINDFKFLLDVNVKQISMENEKVILYAPEIITNQIIPKYQTRDLPMSSVGPVVHMTRRPPTQFIQTGFQQQPQQPNFNNNMPVAFQQQANNFMQPTFQQRPPNNMFYS